jgi:hypothetical protein
MDTTHAQALSLFVRFIPEDYHVLILASSVAVVSIHQRRRIAASLKVSNDASWPIAMAPMMCFLFYLGYLYGSSGQNQCNNGKDKNDKKIQADAQHGSINIYEEGSNYGLLLDMCQKNNQQMLNMAESFCNTSRTFDKYLCDKEKEILQRDCSINSKDQTRELVLRNELAQAKTVNERMEIELTALKEKYMELDRSLTDSHKTCSQQTDHEVEEDDYWDISKLFV